MNNEHRQRLSVRHSAMGLAVIVLVVGPANLLSQPADAPDLRGDWIIVGEVFSCGAWNLDPFGNERTLCQLPVDRMPLNERAYAWVEFFDEAVSSMWDCAPASLPSQLADPAPWSVDQENDRVLIYYEHDEWLRTIWMDGRSHPPSTELFYKGHSVGWYEGDTLVVESTNFTWDPDGIDDHGHLASSTRKRVTERYTRTGPDTLELEITLDDSLFLTEPFTWTRQFERSEFRPGEWGDCDVGVSRRQLESLPSKYEN